MNLLKQKQNSTFTARVLVVGLFSKGWRSCFISGTGRTTRRFGREGLGARRELLTTDSFVIFEDMFVNPAMEKLIGQFKLCARNGIEDVVINCRYICTRAPSLVINFASIH